MLLHPTKSREVVLASDQVATAVVDFHGRLGIEGDRQSLSARRWVDAATEVRDMAPETGADGVDAARQFGNETLDRAKSVTGKLSSGITERALRWWADDEERDNGKGDGPDSSKTEELGSGTTD
ncbi:MAG TPA: hypothetical protein VGX23_23505 [Actinocrinis sp.]|nr:hypothetical protein [Actinocrinis sp.]